MRLTFSTVWLGCFQRSPASQRLQGLGAPTHRPECSGDDGRLEPAGVQARPGVAPTPHPREKALRPKRIYGQTGELAAEPSRSRHRRESLAPGDAGRSLTLV